MLCNLQQEGPGGSLTSHIPTGDTALAVGPGGGGCIGPAQLTAAVPFSRWLSEPCDCSTSQTKQLFLGENAVILVPTGQFFRADELTLLHEGCEHVQKWCDQQWGWKRGCPFWCYQVSSKTLMFWFLIKKKKIVTLCLRHRKEMCCLWTWGMAMNSQMWPDQTSAEVQVHVYMAQETQVRIYHFILGSNLPLLGEYFVMHWWYLSTLVYFSLGQVVTLARSRHRNHWLQRGLSEPTHGGYWRSVLHHEPPRQLLCQRRCLRWCRPRAAAGPWGSLHPRSSAPCAASPRHQFHWLFRLNGIGQHNKIITTWPLLCHLSRAKVVKKPWPSLSGCPGLELVHFPHLHLLCFASCWKPSRFWSEIFHLRLLFLLLKKKEIKIFSGKLSF